MRSRRECDSAQPLQSGRYQVEVARFRPVVIDKVLDWIDQLRDMFGEPRVDHRPWKGNDFRL